MEDLWTQTEEQPTEVTNEEVTTTEETSDVNIDQPEVEIDQEFLDLIDKTLADINAWAEVLQEQEEEDPTEPVFNENPDNYITEEELDKLESSFVDMENIIKDLHEEKTSFISEIDDLNAIISQKDEDIALIEDAWTKISEHPVLWKYAKEIISWKEVNIPEILEKVIEDEISEIPDIDNASSAWSTQKPQNLQDIFSATPDWVK